MNVLKILELTLNDGVDPLSGKRIGPNTGDPEEFRDFEDLYEAFEAQLNYVVEWKVKVSEDLDRMYGENVPASFLSLYIADCVRNGRDYYAGGARYNTDYIQCVGLGTVTDSLSALKTHVSDGREVSLKEFLSALESDWNGCETLRQRVRNRTPFYGNDDDRADSIASRVLDTLIETIQGRTPWRGGI